MKIELTGDFLKADELKGGEVVEILDAGIQSEITSPEGNKKKILNFKVKMITGDERTYTPNKISLKAFVEAWGDESEKWIGKKFKVEIVKVNVFGVIKGSIHAIALDSDATPNTPEIIKI